MSKKCDCEFWKVGMEHIADYIRVMHQEGRGGYKGKIFKFCPWCGTELILESVVKKVVRVPVPAPVPPELAKPEEKE